MLPADFNQRSHAQTGTAIIVSLDAVVVHILPEPARAHSTIQDSVAPFGEKARSRGCRKASDERTRREAAFTRQPMRFHALRRRDPAELLLRCQLPYARPFELYQGAP